MQKADSLEKALMLGKIQGKRRGWQSMRWLDGIIDSKGYEFKQAPDDSEGQGSVGCCSPWGSQRVGHNWETEQQQYKFK